MTLNQYACYGVDLLVWVIGVTYRLCAFGSFLFLFKKEHCLFYVEIKERKDKMNKILLCFFSLDPL